MAILRHRKLWQRKPNPNTLREKHKLTPDEEAGVRRAMAALRIRYGDWIAVARALKTDRTTITRIICIRKRASAGFAVRVARLLGVPVADVLGGSFPRAAQCPFCGQDARSAPVAEWEERLARAARPEFCRPPRTSIPPE